jgi:hypothetical protein
LNKLYKQKKEEKEGKIKKKKVADKKGNQYIYWQICDSLGNNLVENKRFATRTKTSKSTEKERYKPITILLSQCATSKTSKGIHK